ncbi:BQ5605_C009g05572 [Microbotryum silenes-dioicae]|uniref:Derlin n=1 Tax=Microbotryum silenes-dioicae TaxID=796604 RepID=A0A2X0MI49_9BASI|nr:BQ5605_C009g05572 [Microbotryum silenes-dioicae]
MEIGDLPIVTKCYLASAVALSVAVQCNVVTPLQLYFTYRSAFEHGQLWRIATCFMYWGPLGLDFFFHIFFFMRYSKMLEESTFHGRRADYIWLLTVSCALLLVSTLQAPTTFLTVSALTPLSLSLVYTARARPTDPLSPITFPIPLVTTILHRTSQEPIMLVYLWSRLNPTVRLSLFGIITITAPYLPYALCLFSWALAGGGTGWGMGAIMGDALGLLTGHWWYFWTEVWKRERASGSRNWLETPRILVKLFDSPERIREVEEADRQAALARAQAIAATATAGTGRR